MNKIALFTATPSSATALIIAATTQCPFSHAAVCIDGQWYHSSESTGGFGPMEPADFANRHATVYEFEGDLSEWLEKMKGKQYDWRGIAGWVMKSVGLNKHSHGNPKQFYCFETALDALITARRHALWNKRYSGQLDQALRDIYRHRTGYDISEITEVPIHLLPGSMLYTLGAPEHKADAASQLVMQTPVAGCDIAELFAVGRFGRFGDLDKH